MIGAFLIGIITGEDGLKEIAPLLITPFKGVLCPLLLEYWALSQDGACAKGAAWLDAGAIAFGIVMPMIGAIFGLGAAVLLVLALSSALLLMVLSASTSYIAVPATMRIALPEANPSVYLTLSLGVTFPFNLIIGISTLSCACRYRYRRLMRCKPTKQNALLL